MYYDLKFPYRIEAGCEIGKQDNGEQEVVYMSITLGNCKKPITEERYNEMHEDKRQAVADMLGEDVSLVTLISGEEYEANVDMDE